MEIEAKSGNATGSAAARFLLNLQIHFSFLRSERQKPSPLPADRGTESRAHDAVPGHRQLPGAGSEDEGPPAVAALWDARRAREGPPCQSLRRESGQQPREPSGAASNTDQTPPKSRAAELCGAGGRAAPPQPGGHPGQQHRRSPRGESRPALSEPRVTGWARLEGATLGHPAQPLCSSGVIPEHTPRDCVQMVLGHLFPPRPSLTNERSQLFPAARLEKEEEEEQRGGGQAGGMSVPSLPLRPRAPSGEWPRRIPNFFGTAKKLREARGASRPPSRTAGSAPAGNTSSLSPPGRGSPSPPPPPLTRPPRPRWAEHARAPPRPRADPGSAGTSLIFPCPALGAAGSRHFQRRPPPPRRAPSLAPGPPAPPARTHWFVGPLLKAGPASRRRLSPPPSSRLSASSR
ncbi:basic salivary proline-rich protein 2-like [Onychostruthus taczanowskii]|uniref:basic salivary proline-rich protein 2-like n=1 Tax=Onychostruthus taczanowskii TaxID=356909 RepID=UPI001B80D9DD|nr:basic salivary proline-rich protein 2-like [Onychostruthus taczanowskii]